MSDASYPPPPPPMSPPPPPSMAPPSNVGGYPPPMTGVGPTSDKAPGIATAAMIIGIVAAAGLMVGFLPCLGWMNWLNIPLGGIGVIISAIALPKSPVGRKGMAVTGLVLSLLAVLLGTIRLIAGGGLV